MSKNRKTTTEYLSTILKVTRDKRLVLFYTEYLVVLKLNEKGHTVEVLKKTGPNILAKDLEWYVEVKSGHSDLSDWGCGASFGKGRSIENREFDHCVRVLVFEAWENRFELT